MARLDIAQLPRRDILNDSRSDNERPWDQFSEAAASAAPTSTAGSTETPLTWPNIVQVIYDSGLIDPALLPDSPEPVRSVIGGPTTTEKRRVALPPSPLTQASLPAAMRSCWGGPWPTASTHQPPPPNAALHPGPATWVADFRARYHSGPGLDLRPHKLSAREKEWAGTNQPPVDHSWMIDIETMARAQLSCLSNLEWLFGVFMDSKSRASPTELDTIRGFAVKELQNAIFFSGAQIAAATISRRRAILEPLQNTLSQTTRNWLQLQPVELRTHQGLFGPASAAVPEIIRQQPPPVRETQPRRPRAPRPPARQAPARDPAPAPRRDPPAARRPAATYTPTAAAEKREPAPAPASGRGATAARGSKASKRRA